ncbi:MAG: HEAT repeat domain-containing protein [Chthoniobacteraceae bacterium]
MKVQAVAAIIAPVVALGAPFLWPKFVNMRTSLLDTTPASLVARAAAPAPVEKVATAEKPDAPAIVAPHSDFTDLRTSIEQGTVAGELRGNGRDWVRAKLHNQSPNALKLRVEVGQMIEAGFNAVIAVHPAFVEIPAGGSGEIFIETAAVRSVNKTSEQAYRLTYGRLPKVDTFLTFAQDRPDLSLGAIQTAVLALTENLPLSAICKFPTVASEIKSRFNTDAFRVETGDIMSALVALRDAGVPDSSVVMTIDPQLKIESMIDPACRAVAMHYYGLNSESEWAYWRDELLKGDPSTRHYALYGIARFYPDTALEMLPKWARETRTSPVFRLAAVQALAETQRPEALPLLRQLAAELGSASELGRAASGAADYLESRLAAAATRMPSPVAFRGETNFSQF